MATMLEDLKRMGVQSRMIAKGPPISYAPPQTLRTGPSMVEDATRLVARALPRENPGQYAAMKVQKALNAVSPVSMSTLARGAQAFQQAGGGVEGVGAAVGTAARASQEEKAGAPPSSGARFLKAARSAYSPPLKTAPAPAPAPAPAAPPGLPYTRTTQAFVGPMQNGAPPAGGTVTFENSKGSAAGQTSDLNRRGGFVGAGTDAEAARNLQARMEQDAAGSYMAQQFNRQTQALQDQRAAAQGFPAAGAQEPVLSVGKAGDYFGKDALDAESSRVSYDRNLTPRQNALRFADAESQRAGRRADDDRAAQLQGAQLTADAGVQQARLNAGATETAARTRAASEREVARFNQQGELQKTAATEGARAETATTDRLEKGVRAAQKRVSELTNPDGKNPARLLQPDLNQFLGSLDTAKLAESFGGNLSPQERMAQAQRIKAGQFMSEDEVNKYAGEAIAWKNAQPGWWGSIFKTGPSPNEVMRFAP